MMTVTHGAPDPGASPEIRDPLLSALAASNAVTHEAALRFQAAQRGHYISADDAYTLLKGVPEGAIAKALASLNNLNFVDLAKVRGVRADLIDGFPDKVARRHQVLPVGIQDGELVIAGKSPAIAIAEDDLRLVLNRPFKLALAAPAEFDRLWRSYESQAAAQIPAEGPNLRAVAKRDGESPVVQLINQVFVDAVRARASEIYMEPQDSSGQLRVRFRVDGTPYLYRNFDPHLSDPLVSRVKIMAEMDIGEKRHPLDGRISLSVDSGQVDCRVATLPVGGREHVTIRILDSSQGIRGLEELGLNGSSLEWLRARIQKPDGIILVTGPTGSGKTTTLYSALQELNGIDRKIITIENPVEYRLPGITQVQVRSEIDLNFADILRATLRHKPDVILVGEIRDLETAQVAIEAAETGHLVFSTLHTPDTVVAASRLANLGVAPFKVAETLGAVAAQRLVRTLCDNCAIPAPSDERMLALLGVNREEISDCNFRNPCGCEECHRTGYSGQIAVFERLDADNGEVRDMILARTPSAQIRAAAIESGALYPMISDAALKVLAGLTSLEEVVQKIGLPSA